MESPNRETRLPPVEESDLLLLMFDDITDADHVTRWKQFAAAHPVLAREVVQRAYIASRDDKLRASPFEIQRKIIDAVTFAVAALEIAVKRSRDAVTSDDGAQPL